MDPEDDDEEVKGLIQLVFTTDGRIIYAKDGDLDHADMTSARDILQARVDLGEPIQ